MLHRPAARRPAKPRPALPTPCSGKMDCPPYKLKDRTDNFELRRYESGKAGLGVGGWV